MSAVQSFARSGFAKFIGSTAGRLLRVVVGAGLVYWGYVNLATTGGKVALAAGVLAFLAGAVDLCYISALLGGPLSGRKVAELGRK